MGSTSSKAPAVGSVAAQSATPCRPIVLSGPSGTGKSTLINMLMKDYPSDFGFSVSHTTRPQRAGEQNGVHYHFTTMDNMQRMIAEGGFIEHANVYGKYYGTSKKAVADVAKEGKICILDIDTQGARSMRAQNVDGKFLFVAPPSFEELERRLRGRGTDREEVIAKRLNAANGEMAGSKEPGLYDQVLVNGEVCKCYKEFEKILDEEIKRCRQVR